MRYPLILTGAIILIVLAFHFSKPLPDVGTDEKFLPKANYVRYLSAGHEITAAGLFWVRGLIDLGDSYLTGHEYSYLGHVGELSTQLDSLFYTPYYFVGGVTPIGAVDTSDFSVMRRAIRVYPEDWRLALYFAIRLANGPYKDNAGAAAIMKRYANNPDTTIPPHIKTIYRTFELGAMQTEIALSTIIDDCMKPQYHGFLGSFYAKTLRVLGYGPLETGSEKIRTLISQLMEHHITPQEAYDRLLALKKTTTS
jgi:hypothetical protein